MRLSVNHEKHDCRKARDSEKDTDLSPNHLFILRDIGVGLRGTNSRKTDWRGGLPATSPSCRELLRKA
jgi:hypothetical protein